MLGRECLWSREWSQRSFKLGVGKSAEHSGVGWSWKKTDQTSSEYKTGQQPGTARAKQCEAGSPAWNGRDTQHIGSWKGPEDTCILSQVPGYQLPTIINRSMTDSNSSSHRWADRKGEPSRWAPKQWRYSIPRKPSGLRQQTGLPPRRNNNAPTEREFGRQIGKESIIDGTRAKMEQWMHLRCY